MRVDAPRLRRGLCASTRATTLRSKQQLVTEGRVGRECPCVGMWPEPCTELLCETHRDLSGIDARRAKRARTQKRELHDQAHPRVRTSARDDRRGRVRVRRAARRLRSHRQRVRLQHRVQSLSRLRRQRVRHRRVSDALRREGQRFGGRSQRGEPMRGVPQRDVLRGLGVSVLGPVRIDRSVALMGR
jgi:hypothetical protein